MASKRTRVSAIAGVSVLALSLVVGSGMDALAGKGNKGGKGKGNGVKTVKVTADNLGGWAFYNDQADEGIAPQFEVEPRAGKKDKGSAFLTVNNAEGELLSTRAFAGTPLKDIKKLRYTTYVTTGTTAPSLQIGVSFPEAEDAEAYQGRLVWVPSQAEPIDNEEWLTLNPLKHGGDAFFFSRFANPYTNGKCTHGNFTPDGGSEIVGDGQFCTLEEIMEDYPGLQINPDGDAPTTNQGAGTGILGFKVGSAEGDVDANIDTLEIEVKGKKKNKTTVYDFGG